MTREMREIPEARTLEALEAIERLLTQTGRAPTLEEIGRTMRPPVLTRSGVKRHVDRLEQLGLLTRLSGCSRSVVTCRRGSLEQQEFARLHRVLQELREEVETVWTVALELGFRLGRRGLVDTFRRLNEMRWAEARQKVVDDARV